MHQKQTLPQREKEYNPGSLVWQDVELQELACRIFTESGESRRIGKSAITYILVYEREQGIISAV